MADQRARRTRPDGSGGKASPAEVARQGSRQLVELLGREPEGIVSLERDGDGWVMGVEVLELRRIPDTADVLAIYEVQLDESGALTGYRRSRRYLRGGTQEGG